MDPVPLQLPEGCTFNFVAEGAANIVFEIGVPQKTWMAADPLFQGKLLRVAKADTHAFPHETLQAYWEGEVRPLFNEVQLFEDCLVCQCLVRLSTRHVQRLNAVLQSVDVGRRKHPSPVKYPVAYGMLVEDMRASEPGEVAFEFKPKWLAQSPRAPALAARCRTCAQEAWKAIHRPACHAHASLHHLELRRLARPPLCPLDLLACRTDNVALATALDGLLAGVANVSDTQRAAFRTWLQTNRLVPRLRDVQVRMDNERCCDGGIAAAADDDGQGARGARNLALAMTLRDCSCFVRISAAGEVEAKLADLDKKNSDAKASAWGEQESRLEAEGYYHGQEKLRQVTNCLLGRKDLASWGDEVSVAGGSMR